MIAQLKNKFNHWIKLNYKINLLQNVQKFNLIWPCESLSLQIQPFNKNKLNKIMNYLKWYKHILSIKQI